MVPQGAAAEWRTGWPYVASTFISILGSIFMTFGLGQFMTPLGEEFGWTRAQIAFPTVIYSIGTICFAMALGGLVDRKGPRRVALIGVPLTGLTIAAVGLSGPAIWSYYAAWAAYAVVGLTLGPIPWTAAVTRHFKVSRGLALAIGYSASGVGGAMWPPLTLWLIEHVGWRGAFFGIGFGIALVVTPLAYILFRGPVTEPRDKVAELAPQAQPLHGLTLRQAISSTMFWRIGLVLMVTAAAAASTSVHLPAMLTDKGISAGYAAVMAGAIGPALICGRLSCGWLLDRLPARLVTAGFISLAALGCLLYIGYDGNQLRGITAAVLIGLTMGAEGDLLAYLLSRYFGMRSFSAIYGLGLAVFGIGYGGAPWASGLIFDNLRNYDLGYGILAVSLVVCVGVALTLGRYPEFSAPEEDEARGGAAESSPGQRTA